MDDALLSVGFCSDQKEIELIIIIIIIILLNTGKKKSKPSRL
jgi:hypothetical protein